MKRLTTYHPNNKLQIINIRFIAQTSFTMKKITALLLCAISLNAFAQKNTEDPRFKGLDTAFQRVLKNWHVAGFAVAVIEKNKVVYAKGFGYRDVAGKKPVTPNPLFAIGSCTKA